MSLRSPKNRIEGNWKVEKYLVRGIDSTEFVNCLQINLTTHASGEWDWVWDYSVCDCNETYLENQTSQWSFDHASQLDYKHIYFGAFHNDSLVYGPFNNNSFHFIILKLTNKEMVLESYIPDSNYRIELAKQ